jgi:hypothetical protein
MLVRATPRVGLRIERMPPGNEIELYVFAEKERSP